MELLLRLALRDVANAPRGANYHLHRMLPAALYGLALIGVCYAGMVSQDDLLGRRILYLTQFTGLLAALIGAPLLAQHAVTVDQHSQAHDLLYMTGLSEEAWRLGRLLATLLHLAVLLLPILPLVILANAFGGASSTQTLGGLALLTVLAINGAVVGLLSLAWWPRHGGIIAIGVMLLLHVLCPPVFSVSGVGAGYFLVPVWLGYLGSGAVASVILPALLWLLIAVVLLVVSMRTTWYDQRLSDAASGPRPPSIREEQNPIEWRAFHLHNHGTYASWAALVVILVIAICITQDLQDIIALVFFGCTAASPLVYLWHLGQAFRNESTTSIDLLRLTDLESREILIGERLAAVRSAIPLLTGALIGTMAYPEIMPFGLGILAMTSLTTYAAGEIAIYMSIKHRGSRLPGMAAGFGSALFCSSMYILFCIGGLLTAVIMSNLAEQRSVRLLGKGEGR